MSDGDLRVCWVGDSYVAGAGDPLCLGWAGRLAARAFSAGRPLTSYNLGVRRETSARIRDRWLAECAPRLREGDDRRVVFSLGVNDTTWAPGSAGTRVAEDDSVANLRAVLDGAAEQRWPALVVGPPAVDDDAQNARSARLDARFAEVCRAAGAPYVPVHDALRASAVWMREVRAGDGAHPGVNGYDELAALVEPAWWRWLGEPNG